MTETSFDPASSIIVVHGTVWGRQERYRELNLVFDTGASVTTIAPYIIDLIGYSARDGETTASVRSPIGIEQGYLIRVARLRVLGHEFSDFRVHALDVSDADDVHGLVGLDFLRHFNCALRFGDGRIRLDRLTDRDAPSPAIPA